MPSDQNIPAKIVIDPHKPLQHLDAKQLRRPGDFPAECRRSNSNCAAMIPPLVPRSNSADFAISAAVETAPFLRSCALCQRRLNLGRDIFMYRGEIAFCSLECRQQLMNLEERRKSSLLSLKGSAPGNSEPSGSGKTVAAA
ncbi:uncharacterized protein LOC110033412 isoform X2 [Phalaenopsis equestris]|uniref:uncharacterized protein LOC110033412 isoform X2 n=1 Tax=Phalaenopsis equestris TaxID=78828 RepID=UPI0009E254F2|nr:uncharacterized protein LOC110033412 isoform X2 [Phalaenopsis equestris]